MKCFLSGILIAVILLLMPAQIQAATMININTASAEQLQTLPGIGAVISGRIVEYRQIHGLFAVIDDIQNVSGIGPSTFGNIKHLLAVDGDTVIVKDEEPIDDQPVDQDQINADQLKSTDDPSAHADPAPLSIIEPKPDFDISAGRDRLTAVGVPLKLSGQIVAGQISRPRFTWSLGDGTSQTGTNIIHTYHFPGQYQVVLNVADGDFTATARLVVEVVAAEVIIANIDAAADYIELINQGESEINLGQWQIKVDDYSINLASDTIIVAQQILKLPLSSIGLAGIDFTDQSIELLTPTDLVVDRFNLGLTLADDPAAELALYQAEIEFLNQIIIDLKTDQAVSPPVAPSTDGQISRPTESTVLVEPELVDLVSEPESDQITPATDQLPDTEMIILGPADTQADPHRFQPAWLGNIFNRLFGR